MITLVILHQHRKIVHDTGSSDASDISTPKYLKSLLIVSLTNNIRTKTIIKIIITLCKSQSYSSSLIGETTSKKMTMICLW